VVQRSFIENEEVPREVALRQQRHALSPRRRSALVCHLMDLDLLQGQAVQAAALAASVGATAQLVFAAATAAKAKQRPQAPTT